MPIASIDIGTNTFRILVVERNGSEFKKIYIDRVITRLGGGFKKKEKLISPQASQRGISALKDFAETLQKYKVEKVRAVATSVVRESLNGYEFIDRVARETGIHVEVISGEEEAKLTVDGVLNSVSPASEYSVIFDIGGGSTEYIYIKGGDIIGLISTKMGVVHLTEKLLKNDIPSKSDIKLVSDEIEDILSKELSWMGDSLPDSLTLIATAGTPTTLAAIEMELEIYDPDIVNGFMLQRAMVERIFNKLIKMTPKERLGVKGLEKGREDILIPGILIVLRTMDRFSKESVLVSDGGLLEGIAYNMII